MSRARIRRVAGPVLEAIAQGPFALREAVRVGPQALLGEVVRLDGDAIVVQVYEDTTGLRPGVLVEGDGLPLSIRVGPGLLGRIFDGLLRPLSGSSGDFVRPGMRRADAVPMRFVPGVAPGDVLAPGGRLARAPSSTCSTQAARAAGSRQRAASRRGRRAAPDAPQADCAATRRDAPRRGVGCLLYTSPSPRD